MDLRSIFSNKFSCVLVLCARKRMDKFGVVGCVPYFLQRGMGGAWFESHRG